MGVARKGNVSHLLIQCVPISVLASHKNTIYHNIVLRELPGFVDTKVSKFYPIMRPLYVALVVVVVMMDASIKNTYLA